jgi:hypothetical protein
MTRPTTLFRPMVDTLENRIVPDASSVFDPNFFNTLNFEQYDAANQATNDRVRVFNNIYQTQTQQVDSQELDIQKEEKSVQGLTQDQMNALIQADQNVRKQLLDQLNQVQKANKDEEGSAQNSVQSAINALKANPAGKSPQEEQAEINILLGTYQKFAANITAEAATETKAIMDQIATLQVSEQDKLSAMSVRLQMDLIGLQNAANQLQQVYSARTRQEIDSLYANLRQIQSQLKADLQALQNAYNAALRAAAIQQQQGAAIQQLNQISLPPANDPDDDGDTDDY